MDYDDVLSLLLVGTSFNWAQRVMWSRHRRYSHRSTGKAICRCISNRGFETLNDCNESERLHKIIIKYKRIKEIEVAIQQTNSSRILALSSFVPRYISYVAES